MISNNQFVADDTFICIDGLELLYNSVTLCRSVPPQWISILEC